MSIGLRFTNMDWERIERDWTAGWAGELEQPMVIIECLEGDADAIIIGALAQA